MRAISGSIASALGHGSANLRGVHRAAVYTALAWSVILLAWAVYNAAWQVGVGDFLRGIFYYGSGDDTGRAETANFNYAVVYIAASVLVLRGSAWGRGMAAGAALIEGYNRLRSLTGAVFDSRQKDWFTHTTQGELKLATFAAGFVVTAALVVMLVRNPPEPEPWSPPANPWTQLAQQAHANPYPQQPAPPYQQQQYQQQQPPQQPQPGYGYPAQQPVPQQQVQQPYAQQSYQQPQQPQLPGGQPPQPPNPAQ